MWVRGISQYSKDETVCKKHDKGELSKAIKNAENRFASRGFAPLNPLPGLCPGPTGAYAAPLTPRQNWCPPKGSVSGSGPVLGSVLKVKTRYRMGIHFFGLLKFQIFIGVFEIPDIFFFFFFFGGGGGNSRFGPSLRIEKK